jgi:hypothetical protein
MWVKTYTTPAQDTPKTGICDNGRLIKYRNQYFFMPTEPVSVDTDGTHDEVLDAMSGL